MIFISKLIDFCHKGYEGACLNCEKFQKMSIIILLIAIGLVIALGFILAFIWAVRSGQYDDDYTPSIRILFDEHKEEKKDS